MKAAGHVLPSHVCSPVRPGPEPREPGSPSCPGVFSVFQEMSPGLVGTCIREAGRRWPKLGLGQRALWGVLLDLAACPLVTQVRWSSPAHNAPLNSGLQKRPSFPKAPSNALDAREPSKPRLVAIRSSFIHTPLLLETSSPVNLRLNAPGPTTSWSGSRKRGSRIHSPWVLSSSISAFGRGGCPPRVTSPTGIRPWEKGLIPFLSPPRHLVSSLGTGPGHTRDCIQFCFPTAACCPPN